MLFYVDHIDQTLLNLRPTPETNTDWHKGSEQKQINSRNIYDIVNAWY